MLRSRLLTFIVIILVLWGGVKLSDSLTDGFFVANIIYDLPFDLRRPVKPPSPERLESVRDILMQDYFYLCKGRQAYVFESADGNYVLKFFKYQRMRPLWWAKTFGWIPAINSVWEERSAVNESKLERLFNGCKIAYEDVADITGLVYVKLDNSFAPVPTVVIHDKLGIAHEIPLDERQFIVQLKAEPFDERIITLLAEKQYDEAEALIFEMLGLLLEEYKRGYMDLDPGIMKNTALLDERPIHIDIGQFVRINETFESSFVKQDFLEKTNSFLEWLSGINGEMASRIDESVEQLMIDHGI